MVQTTVNIGAKDRLKMLEQDILSRSRLMGVINELGLFKEESRKIVFRRHGEQDAEADR